MLDNLLICIGAQKAGTSWLDAILSKDKRFSKASNKFEHVKEIHYFDHLHTRDEALLLQDWRAYYLIDMIKNRGQLLRPMVKTFLAGNKREEVLAQTIETPDELSKRFVALTAEVNDDWYEDLLKCRDDQRYSLDITPDYSVLDKEAFSHMGNVSKNLKMIYILRDPLDRAWSGILQRIKNSPGGIEAFAKTGLNDLNDLYKRCTIGLDVGARTNYRKTVENIYAAGLQDNLKVLFYDHISEKPEEFIDSIYDFIGMDSSPMKSQEYLKELSTRVYSTEGKIEIPEALEKKLIFYYKPMLERLMTDYGIVLPDSWIKKYNINIR